ncbi:hypothetical protein D3C80_1580440 [compost metagenome]
MVWLSWCAERVMKPWSTSRRMPWPMDRVMAAVTTRANKASSICRRYGLTNCQPRRKARRWRGETDSGMVATTVAGKPQTTIHPGLGNACSWYNASV